MIKTRNTLYVLDHHQDSIRYRYHITIISIFISPIL